MVRIKGSLKGHGGSSYESESSEELSEMWSESSAGTWDTDFGMWARHEISPKVSIASGRYLFILSDKLCTLDYYYGMHAGYL